MALESARLSNKHVILIFGGNWCHDSRALTGWFQTPRFAAMLLPKYELVYVDVGNPKAGNGRNLDIASRFGIKQIKGTPTVLIVTPDSKPLNLDAAAGWKNAASRKEEDIFAYFSDFGAISSAF